MLLGEKKEENNNWSELRRTYTGSVTKQGTRGAKRIKKNLHDHSQAKIENILYIKRKVNNPTPSEVKSF